VQHFGSDEGLRAPNVFTVFVDGKGDIWIGSSGGLSWFQDGHIRTVNSQQGLPADQVFTILEDSYNRLWFTGFAGIAAIDKKSLAEWASGAIRKLNPILYRGAEGLQIRTTGSVFPDATRSPDGNLWFSIADGVAEVTPPDPATSRVPQFPVLVEDITVDGESHVEPKRLRIPPGARSIELRYTALTLSSPETIRFRYLLEGIDNDWVDSGTRRLAFYNNLKPRAYKFRVAASAGEGRWLESSPLALEQLPFFYQTWWFTVLVSSAVLSLAFLVHRLRVHQITREFNANLEGRVSERTRVARDLHDTLLQSFQAVLMKFSAVQYMIPTRPIEAAETLERTIEQARTALIEGRNAVAGLRSSTVVTNDLARAIMSDGEKLLADQIGENRPELRLRVEGKSRDLPPILRDEIYNIACEALRNAFRHAHARRIEVEIRYEPRHFRLQVQDDGKGIDAKVLGAGGREGHYGLPGIQERAKLAGGKLVVRSGPGSGTEIELTIPASLAYVRATEHRPMSADA